MTRVAVTAAAVAAGLGMGCVAFVLAPRVPGIPRGAAVVVVVVLAVTLLMTGAPASPAAAVLTWAVAAASDLTDRLTIRALLAAIVAVVVCVAWLPEDEPGGDR